MSCGIETANHSADKWTWLSYLSSLVTATEDFMDPRRSRFSAVSLKCRVIKDFIAFMSSN